MTRPVIAVDLAAKFSAGVTRSHGGEVVAQWDSHGMTPAEVAGRIAYEYYNASTVLERALVVIEDLPPHVPSSLVAKSVAQLQGRIIQQFVTSCPNGALGDVFFVPPAHWERAMGVFRQDPVAVWEPKAAEFGYVPPDLLVQRGLVPGTRGQATAVKEAQKQRTDYVAAFLISEWARRDMATNAVWDSKVIKQYRS